MKSITARLVEKIEQKDAAMLEDNLLIRELLDNANKLEVALSEAKDALEISSKAIITTMDKGYDWELCEDAYEFNREALKKIEEVLK